MRGDDMFNPIKTAAAICVLGLGALASSPACAQHWRGGPHVGIYFGVPLYAPYYYPAPYYGYPYGYPPVVYAPPAAPPVYVERGDAPPAPPPVLQSVPQSAPQMAQSDASYWYFCPESNAYYPYAKSCASGWQRVAPQPPGPAR